tara:strand:+ start:3413 stop:4168 length:756 start_codon:yes stop_codon:yes gene_type:complete
LTSGFLAGLLGIGGGIVIVPALALYFAELNRHDPENTLIVAVATSLACIVFTTASAAITQVRAGRVNALAVRRLLPALVIGSPLAGYLAPLLPMAFLKTFFGLFLLAVAAVMFLQWKPAPHRQLPGTGLASVIGAAVGCVSALVGIAGGNILVPTLTYFNVAPHQATATASVLGVPLALFGALSYGFWDQPTDAIVMLGWIDLEAVLPIIAGAIIAAPVGVRFAQRVPATMLKRLFALMLLLAAARMLSSL